LRWPLAEKNVEKIGRTAEMREMEKEWGIDSSGNSEEE